MTRTVLIALLLATGCSEESEPAGECGGASCDDGIACTRDVCSAEETCSQTPIHSSCPAGQVCNAAEGCIAAPPCATVADCPPSGTPCVTVQCGSAIATCVYSPLDGDGDGHPPLVCVELGGDDCDDSNANVSPAASEETGMPGGPTLGCDGLDNDCNLAIDDLPLLGSSCDGADGDLCEEGRWVCAGSGMPLACDDPNDQDGEVCNSVDDNCDGTVDEGGNPCGGVCMLPGAPGGACDGPDGDQCTDDLYSCSDRNTLSCSVGDEDVEQCNTADDDCDGWTDEGCPGELSWAARAGGTGADGGVGIAASNDSIVVVGYFQDTAMFGPGASLASSGSTDFFLTKYDLAGNVVWAKRAGGAGSDHGVDVAILPDGSILATGQFSATATFGPGEAAQTVLLSAGGYDVFLAKFGASGNLVWARRAGGPSVSVNQDSVSELSALPDGSFFVAGSFWDSITFGPGEAGETTLASAEWDDIFVAKYAASGSLLWAKRAGGGLSDAAWGVSALTADGGALVSGLFYQSAVFGQGEAGQTTLVAASPGDIFVARYASSGSLSWARRAGGLGGEGGSSVGALNDAGGVVVGSFNDVATFAPGEPSQVMLTSDSASSDVFLARYGSTGSVSWAKRAGGSGEDLGVDVAVAGSDDSSAITGRFSNTATFGVGDPGQRALTASGGWDVFVASYEPSGTLRWARPVGGPEQDMGFSVAMIPSGGVVVTGQFSASAVFGASEPAQTTLVSAGGADVFVARFAP